MNKCINCAYFLNCENASEENACDNYKFIRKNIEKEETKSQIERLIEIKNLEREIADIFYKMCPSVPPQTLATEVRQTLDNFKNLEKLYENNSNKRKNIFSIDSLEYMKNIDIPSTIKEQKMLDDNYKHTPRIN